jgi:hypothetical protein
VRMTCVTRVLRSLPATFLRAIVCAPRSPLHPRPLSAVSCPGSQGASAPLVNLVETPCCLSLLGDFGEEKVAVHVWSTYRIPGSVKVIQQP